MHYPLFIVLLASLAVPVRQEEGVEVVPHREQLASASNSTCGAEPGVFPGHGPAAVPVLCCWDMAWGAQPPTAGFGAGGQEHCPPFHRGQGLQFPSDQGLWAKFHPNTFVEVH